MFVVVVVRLRVRGHLRDLFARATAGRTVTTRGHAPRPPDHENLDVYQLSIEFFSLALRLLEVIPSHRRALRSQWERAAVSVPLNIAEGCGKPTLAERAQFHGIARGSAMECGALLDVCGLMGHANAEEVERGKTMLVRVVAMLTKMCR